jgi:hypothetical protein
LKTLTYAIAAGIAIAAIGVLLALYAGNSIVVGESYSAGNFTVHVLENSGSRFLARLENNGTALNSTAAFAVKKGLNENCEPQGIVVANFQVRSEEGRVVPEPNSIPGNSSVTLDSRQSNINVIPTEPDFETAVYILGLEPGSIRASELIQKIPIQALNSSELELFENCQQEYGGYPLQLKLLNPQHDTQVYMTVSHQSATHEAAIEISPDAPNFSELFWPASRNDWLSGNFMQPSGPAPAWADIETVRVSVSIVYQNQLFTFEDSVTPRLVTTSLDFFEVAKGDPLPSYPRYWEIQVDLANGTIS